MARISSWETEKTNDFRFKKKITALSYVKKRTSTLHIHLVDFWYVFVWQRHSKRMTTAKNVYCSESGIYGVCAQCVHMVLLHFPFVQHWTLLTNYTYISVAPTFFYLLQAVFRGSKTRLLLKIFREKRMNVCTLKKIQLSHFFEYFNKAFVLHVYIYTYMNEIGKRSKWQWLARVHLI